MNGRGWVMAVGLFGVAVALALAGKAETEAGTKTLAGFCEASAVLPWRGGYLVADNETEDRLYLLGADLSPAGVLALSAEVEDIEALAIGGGGELVVVGSQGANKKGKPRPGRERVLVQGASPVRPDLSACAACEAARGLPPKEGGLSVEGAAWWQGALWLGVRSPLVGSKAPLLRLAGDPAVSLSVAGTVELDLGGLGVRDLVVGADGLLVLAGPAGATEAPHRLYRLADPHAAPELLPVTLPSGSEGLVAEGGQLLVVTDGDGKPGEPCKVPARWARVPLEAR